MRHYSIMLFAVVRQNAELTITTDGGDLYPRSGLALREAGYFFNIIVHQLGELGYSISLR